MNSAAVTALLDKQAELRLASQFTVARQQISELARSLPSPFHEAAQHEIQQRVDSVLRDLTSREEAIVRMHFGIGSDAAQTLAEVGEELRVSGERVRQAVAYVEAGKAVGKVIVDVAP